MAVSPKSHVRSWVWSGAWAGRTCGAGLNSALMPWRGVVWRQQMVVTHSRGGCRCVAGWWCGSRRPTSAWPGGSHVTCRVCRGLASCGGCGGAWCTLQVYRGSRLRCVWGRGCLAREGTVRDGARGYGAKPGRAGSCGATGPRGHVSCAGPCQTGRGVSCASTTGQHSHGQAEQACRKISTTREWAAALMKESCCD
jgi:hypothetical protein